MDHREINKLSEQFSNGSWPRFVESIKIQGVRGWNDKMVEFKFPVVAIVGENGAGKSTLLKALACAYEGNNKATNFYPTDFFIETQWEKIQNAKIEYRIKYGNITNDLAYSKKTERWRTNKARPKNDVFILEISRTLPLDATAGYAKMAKEATREISRSEIQEDYRKRLSYILGREYESASFVTTERDSKKEVGLLKRGFGEMSQYHQGAGEDSTLDLIRALQNLPNYSFLIIDEVEASLHPKSQRRLMQFLLWFARQKKCQIVLSTHSPYILQELPKEARIMLMNGNQGINVVPGITPEFAMSKLDDLDYPELELIVEDFDSSVWLREIILFLDVEDNIMPRVRISPVGPSNVVQMMGKLGHENKLPYNSLALVDGDKSATEGCIKLPGEEAPEYIVFNGLKEISWSKLDERFDVGAGLLFDILDEAMLNPKHHEWTTKIGNKIRLSAKSVWEILCKEWCKYCLLHEDLTRIKDAIEEKLVDQRTN